MAIGDVLWSPPRDALETSEIGRFVTWLHEERGRDLAGYDELWRWSVDDLEGFWAAIWDFFGIRAHAPYEQVLDAPRMPGARWFTGARLNYAEHLLGTDADTDGGAGELLLFVELADGVALDDDLRARIARLLRDELSPRHVPDAIVAVPGIPRTLTGKKLETPVKAILQGRPPADVISLDALANPAAVTAFVDYAARGSGRRRPRFRRRRSRRRSERARASVPARPAGRRHGRAA